MLRLNSLWILTSLVLTAIASPILQGTNVGKVSKLANGQIKVSGHEEFPYMVRMEITGTSKNENDILEESKFLCGGVIIDEYAVLTAAHCFSDAEGKLNVEIKAGLVNLIHEGRTAQTSSMDSFVIHDGYLEEEIRLEALQIIVLSDIAIVWLKKPFILGDKVRKAVLHASESDPPTNSEGWIVGWGSTTLVPSKTSDTLKKAKAKVMDRDQCQALCGKVVVIDDMFCVRSDNKKSSASVGDSGGPFVLNGTVYGISSFALSKKQRGKIVCDTSKPQFFTNVGGYVEWIKEQLELHRKAIQHKPNVMINFLNAPSTSQNNQAYTYQTSGTEGKAKKPRKSKKL